MNAALVRQCPLFRLLDDEQYSYLKDRLQTLSLGAEDVLYTEASPADTVAIVLEGTLEVVKLASNGEETLLTEVGPGDVVGEMALVDDRDRSASIRAKTPVKVARMSRAALGAIERQRPDIALSVMRGVSRLLADRLENTSANYAELCR